MYRIIEYASYSYLEANALASVRRIMSSAHALDSIDETTDLVMASLQQANLEPIPRFQAVLREKVDMQLLWREICLNLDTFTQPLEFDGGYAHKKLVTDKSSEKEFLNSGPIMFEGSARTLRNALFHGKDQRTGGAIAPTARNFRLLEPWASVMSVAAGEVVMYAGVR